MPQQVLLFLLAFLASLPCGYAQEAPRKYAAADVKADLAYLYETLEAAHHNLYARTPKRVFEREFQRLYQSLGDSLTPLQLNRLMQPFVALAGHGHCVTGYPFKSYNAFLAGGGRVFPFDVRVQDRRLFVTSNYSSDPTIRPGDEILAIHGVKSSKWLDRLYRYLSGENEYFKNTLVDQIGFPRLFWMVYDQQPVFAIKIRKANRQEVFVTDQGVLASEYKTIRNQQPGVFKPQREFRLIGSVAYLRPGQFANQQSVGSSASPKTYEKGEFLHFIDSAFAQVRYNWATNLILDLRGNPGGDNSFSDPLVAYFATKPLAFASSFSVKTSSVTKNFWKDVREPSLTEMKNRILTAPDGQVFETPLAPYPPRTDSLRYAGRVFVLVDRYTYSNATTVAALIQDYGFGTIIGEPTADCPTLYASVHEFELPRTKVSVTYPKAFMVRPSGDKSPKGVVPDYQVQDDAFSAEDEMLAWTLRHIQGTGK